MPLVRRIMEHAHAGIIRLLTEHREKLDSLTEALLATETLDEARPTRPRACHANAPRARSGLIGRRGETDPR